MTWKIEKTIPTFPVPDLEAGIEFYLRLGFEVDWRWPESDPTHAGLILGDCSIMLSRCEPMAPGDAYFIVDDIAACHAFIMNSRPWDLAERCGALAQSDNCPPERAKAPPPEPQEQGYGLLDFSILDPWGTSLSFGQPLGDS